MSSQNHFEKLEKGINKSDFRVKGINGYLLLRDLIYHSFLNETYNYSAKTRKSTPKEVLINSIYGINNIFKLRQYDYIFFTNTNKRELIGSTYRDVLFDALADKLGQSKVLFIERASRSHIKKGAIYSENIISDLPFKFLSKICSLFIAVSNKDVSKLNNISVLKQYPIDYKQKLRKRLGEIVFYKLLFKWIKPKSIFVLSSYSKRSTIIAAHLHKIKVIEPQHGYIGNNHLLYNKPFQSSKLYYPDKLLSFGDYEKKIQPFNFSFDENQIVPVGSFYLDYIKESYRNTELESKLSNYKKVFCVTLQTIKEPELLKWIKDHAQENLDWLFILRPKYSSQGYKHYLKLENITLMNSYNIYQILKYSDYNITIYSTTAVEASFFGVKTLFYNVDRLSERYFDISQMYADTINNNQLLNEKHLDKDIKGLNYFKSNYMQNIDDIDI